MRIDAINIDGFGTFSDRNFGQIDSPLTVIYGPNEAGKSTLLGYLRQILFGFPTRRATENNYLIEGNVQHGGSLNVTMDDGRRLIVARHAGRYAAGTVTLHDDQNNPIDTTELPGLLGGATRSVFESIFAFDLRELSSFNSADNEEIASLLYGAGMSAPRMIATLQKVDKAKSDIFRPGGHNQPVAQLLHQLGETESSLRTVQNQSSEFRTYRREHAEIEGCIGEIGQSIIEVQSNRRLLNRHIEAWETWIDLGIKRERLEEIPVFNGFPENAITRLENFEDKLTTARASVEQVTDRHQSATDASAAAIPYESILERTIDVKKIVEQRGAFAGSVRDLPERQADFDRDEARITEDLSTLGSDWSQQRVEDFSVTIALRDQIEQSRLALENAEQDIRDQEIEIKRIESELSDAKQRSNEFDLESTDSDIQPANRVQLLLAIAVAAIGLLLAIAGALIESTIFIGIGIGIGAGVPGVLLAGNLLRARGAQGRGISNADRGRLLENRRIEERLRGQLNSAEQAKIESKQQRSDKNMSWRNWLNSNGLPESLSPVGASDYLTQIDTTKGRVTVATERRNRVIAIQDDVDEYRTLVSDVGELVEISIGDDSVSVQIASTEISELFDSATADERKRAETKRSIPGLATELASVKRELQQLENELAQLLNEGGTENPEEFRRLANQHFQRQELENSEQNLLDSLRHIMGPDYDLENLDSELSENSKDQMNTELDSLDSELKNMEQDRADLNIRVGELNTKISTLVDDDQASILRAGKASLVADLQDHAVDWTRYSLAMALLEMTRQKYEEERQPAILGRASGYFSEFTYGRYERVFSPLGESEFHVVEAGPTPQNKPTSKLSQGTLEQLYLAMRFAAVEEFGEKREHLPVVVDEVLVNFDLERAKKAAGAFGKIAESNQVLVFTCHPWIRDLFEDAVPGAGFIDLDVSPD